MRCNTYDVGLVSTICIALVSVTMITGWWAGVGVAGY